MALSEQRRPVIWTRESGISIATKSTGAPALPAEAESKLRAFGELPAGFKWLLPLIKHE
jgi:hypothetical protein